MNNIKTIKIALMKLEEMDSNNEIGDFNSKFVSTLNIEEILKYQINNINEFNFDENIPEILNLIYEELKKLVKNNKSYVDSIGIWIEYDDKISENAIKLSVLDDIKKYGAKDINPIYEFYKMTLLK